MSGGPVDTGDGTVTNLDREDGYINLFMGSYGTGVTASTKFCDIDVDLKDDGDYTYFDGDLEYRPVRLLFTGDAPIVIDYLEAKTCKIGTHLLSNTNYVSVGSAKLGKAAWFDPFANGHSKWYFGTRDNVNYTTFLGGIEFQEEGVSDTYYDQFDDYKKLPHTSVLRLSPVMRLYNPSIGITTPAQLVFRRSGTQNEIINRTPNGG
jgi:hypothetical protein